MVKSAFFPLLGVLGALGCEPNVVDAVREPAVMPSASVPLPIPMVNPLETSLFHRYSFDGETNAVFDSKGGAHGQAVGVTLPGTGQLPLAGEQSRQFVDLPNYLVSGLIDATFELWLTWAGGAAWQRIFDFGNSDGGEGTPGGGTSYLFLTPATSVDSTRNIPQPVMRLAYSKNGITEEEVCDSAKILPVDAPTHLAVVIERAEESVKLYQDGVLVGDCTLSQPLAALDDVNNWLGQSNFQADAEFAGKYDEFRIYNAALTAEQIVASFDAGPNAR